MYMGVLTEQLAFHTDATVGDFLNSTFGNATCKKTWIRLTALYIKKRSSLKPWMGLWINDSSGINSGGPVTSSLQNSSFGKMNSEVF